VNERTSILVVDENDDSCTMMATLLGQVGYAAETARSVADALKLAHDKRPAMYVIDSYFSDGRGSDLCRQIAALDPQAMVIFYSCAFGIADFEEALRAGAHAYIVKPGIDELLHTITSLINRAGAGQPALLSL
jgi:two-component system, repressor protein LuxO